MTLELNGMEGLVLRYSCAEHEAKVDFLAGRSIKLDLGCKALNKRVIIQEC